ncbi:hypothetical protein DAPPUDRAFT_233669 [Daphnia pulex]|uniref:Uncharacterized protein n=1 Tax=Daphnia pulex TaxID=6669 RepID=E9FVE3_DAPPU|nr:hypothetical protein DAPPUDRAFT_233669 [Daphnia pulex]|eukprot:EFX88539.1 hypothetical protein DAPPUDRAFT_233669 [Daphnia pulex]
MDTEIVVYLIFCFLALGTLPSFDSRQENYGFISNSSTDFGKSSAMDPTII